MAQALYPLYTQGQLDPQAKAFLKQIADARTTPLSSLTPQQARECFVEASWIGAPKQGIKREDLMIAHVGGLIPLRIYTPEGNHSSYPILLFFHGGGFVAGTLEEFDPFCTSVASGASCVVVSVGYRLAPEHPHPAAVEDAVAAIRWITENAKGLSGDPTRMAVAGDSAGGNLAAVSSLILRDQGFSTLRYQILICPWVDLSSCCTDSFRYFGDGLWLSTPSLQWYRDHYLHTPQQAFSPFVSPLLAEDMSGLPSALVITAEFDILRDQGEAYARRLRDHGIAVQWTRYPGMLHDFVILPGLFARAQEAIHEICQALHDVWIE